MAFRQRQYYKTRYLTKWIGSDVKTYEPAANFKHGGKDILEQFEILTHTDDGNIFISEEQASAIENEAEEEQGALDEINNEIVLFSIHPDCWNEIKNFIGNKMSPSKYADIEKLRQGQMISDFKVKPLAKFVREYQKAGGRIFHRDDLFPYTVT